jgi:homoserine dehydrogenase
MKPLQIGLLGLGTVGSGTFQVLLRNQEDIRGRAGRDIRVTMVAARNLERARALVGPSVEVVADARRIVTSPDIDVVVEVIGGCGVAKDLVLEAIANGKHVVTANKALIAQHGTEIFAAAQARGVAVAFEGAVAVSIPIIKALREGLSGNRVDWVCGIINGTTNFILTAMREHGANFEDALAEAQRMGYAESDPSFDVDGIDAAHKIAILASVAFGVPMRFGGFHVEGIRALSRIDVAHAERLGYRVKLLGIARRTAQGIDVRVHPALVPASRLLANVEGSMNGVMVSSDAAGVTMYYGAGAGSEQTASAVIADLVDIARVASAGHDSHVPYLAFRPAAIRDLPLVPIADVTARHYLRLQVMDRPGVLAEVTRILADRSISIDTLIQEGRNATGSPVRVVMLTHYARERDVSQAIDAIEALDTVIDQVTRLRIEELV